jgi:tetratricopeptide (TPR) repeat protein
MMNWPLGMTFGLLLYVETGQLDKAVQAIREEHLRDASPPLNGFAAYVRGAVLEAAGDLTGARQIWTDAVRQSEALLATQESPNSVYAHYGLILNYAKLGNREKAMHFVHQSLAPDPRHPVRLFMVAEAHALLGNRNESLDSLKAAVKNGFFNLPLVEGMARSRICTLYSLRNDPEYLGIRADLARRVEQLRARY